MSNAHFVGNTTTQRPVRVREQAREVLAVVVFSATTATCLALLLVLLAGLGRRG